MRCSEGVVSATETVAERVLDVRDSAGRLRLTSDSARLKTCIGRN